MSAIIAWIHNLWQQIPAGVRGGLALLALAVFSAGMAFTWHFPANWIDAREQIQAFWLIVVPIAVGVFQKSVWPPLFQWILVLLGLAYALRDIDAPPLLVKA